MKTPGEAWRAIRDAGAPGLPWSCVPDALADELLARGAIWSHDLRECYYATAETGDHPNPNPNP